MEPPWTLFPDDLAAAKPQYLAVCIKYGERWLQFFCALPEFEQTEYQRSHPEPVAWRGFYQAIIDGDDEDDGCTVTNPRRPFYPGTSVALRVPAPPEDEL